MSVLVQSQIVSLNRSFDFKVLGNLLSLLNSFFEYGRHHFP